MKGLLSSHRRRRRLLWGTSLLAVVGALVAIGVMYPNTARRTEETTSNEPAVLYKEPVKAKLSKRSRAEALTTAANFVKTAVVRQHVVDSWLLAAPSLRDGYTRAEWAKGDIPVIPFPAEGARWRLDYSYQDSLGLQVLLFPKESSGLRPSLFLMELKPFGTGKSRHWLVDSWIPNGVSAAAGAPRSTPGGGGGGVAGIQAIDTSGLRDESRLGAVWLFFPLGVLALVPLVLIAVGVRSWFRSRRAMRAYSRGTGADLPSYRSYLSH